MNRVLEQALTTGTISNGVVTHALRDNMDREEGKLIERAFQAARPTISIEVGCAYGISTMFACDAISSTGVENWVHHVIDPYQAESWKSLGIGNVERAGYGAHVILHEIKSELILPRLLSAGLRVQAAIIDGWHTFDHTLVDFFFINKMLDVGGIVVIDDTDWPGIERCCKHILSYPCYELFGQAPDPKRWNSARTRLRRHLARSFPSMERHWEKPTAMAFKKIAEDQRRWDWHQPF